MELKCPFCAAPLTQENKYCPRCGQLTPSFTPQTAADKEQPSPAPQDPQPQPMAPRFDQAPQAPNPQPVSPQAQAPQAPQFDQMPQAAQAPQYVRTAPPAKNPKNKTLFIVLSVILACAILIGALAAAGYFFGTGGGSDKRKDKDDDVLSTDSTDGSGDGSDNGNGDQPPAPRRDIGKTIMIYIVGSDLESGGGAASTDIEEMLGSGIDTEQNNVLIYTGGATEWHNPSISPYKNMIFRLNGNSLEELESLNSENMGKSSTLTYFIDYCAQNYESEQYGLILWNHGAGPLLGYGIDEKAHDRLYLDELQQAVDESVFGEDNKLEFIGFDACLMATLEIASSLSDYSKYLIASQEVEPGIGWDYAFLKDLESYQNGEEIGKAVIDSYMSSCQAVFEENPFWESDITLSCMDLSYVDETEECLNELFSKVDSAMLSGSFSSVSRCRYNTKAFATFSDDFYYDLIDLGHMNSLLAEDFPDESEALEDALSDLVCYTQANIEHAGGVSVYHPYDNDYYADDWLADYEELDFASDYTKYIKDFSRLMDGEGTTSWESFENSTITSTTVGGNNVYSIELTEEQANDIAGASYYVFYKKNYFEYCHVFTGQSASLSGSTLSVAYNGQAVYGVDEETGSISENPLPVSQVYDAGDNLKYVLPCTFVNSDESVKVNWQVKLRNGQPVLFSAYELGEPDQNGIAPEKQLISPEDYDEYHFDSPSYIMLGGLVMIATDNSDHYSYTKENGFHLQLMQVDNMSDYYAYIEIRDIYGRTHTSRLGCLG